MFGLNKIIRKATNRITTEISETEIKKKISVKLIQAIGRSFNNADETNKCLYYIREYPEVINFRINGSTPFLKACSSGCKKIIIKMLEYGADINTFTAKGDHPFFLAVCAVVTKNITDFSILDELIESGCPVNQSQKKSYSALQFAASVGHLQLVEWLLQRGADPNPRSYSASPYTLASRNGHTEVAALLHFKQS